MTPRHERTCRKCGKVWGSGLPYLLNVYVGNPKGPECKSLWQCSIRAEDMKNHE
jgi:hypothetical protein